MRDKPYYSVRTGKNLSGGALDLPTTLRVFGGIHQTLEDEGYFQEALGYECVDAGSVPGTVGKDVEGYVLLELRKSDLLPVRTQVDHYREDDLFDVVEFLYEHVSKPVDRHYHSFNDCGWHCTSFDRSEGRAEFREKMNRILRRYADGFELSVDGEVLGLPDAGFEALMEAALPVADPENIEARVDAARRRFRRYKASLDERRDAIRDLADVLEYLRPKLKGILASRDENDLFNLANNFGVRHHNALQKVGYDRAIWYSWLFYYYLATIHAVVRLIRKKEETDGRV
ncbi:MAG: hypothetical protein IT347_11510 [Candidatus Eisenbacteria bacterium]|nr:hypothetical protein [Candidatus Eisenbacteria bacterium]